MSAYVNGSGISYAAYLQAKSFADDLRWDISETNLNLIATKDVLEKQGLTLESGFSDLSQRLETVDETLDEGFRTIGTGLRDGFVTIHSDLNNIEASLGGIEGAIYALSARFDWGIARLEIALCGVQDTLQELVRLARTPEQTWAYEQFDVSRDAFRRELFPEALEYAERAINGDGNHSGYRLEHRFHHLLGIIRRGDYKNNSPEIIDLNKSEQAYILAARYAQADHKKDAANALCGASWVAYCQGNMQRAEAHARSSLAVSETAEANYQLAKILSHTGKRDDAIRFLVSAMLADPVYALRCFDDDDFRELEPRIHAKIPRIRDLFINQTYEIKGKIVEAFKTWSNSYETLIQLMEHNDIESYDRRAIVSPKIEQFGEIILRKENGAPQTKLLEAFQIKRDAERLASAANELREELLKALDNMVVGANWYINFRGDSAKGSQALAEKTLATDYTDEAFKIRTHAYYLDLARSDRDKVARLQDLLQSVSHERQRITETQLTIAKQF